ncbi:MAG: aldo/keto reductase [Candidatus Micrarchaeota archaeon]|nr:aldo/keto reductase [Candidatus Micrarchaeota archaeon]
MQYKELGSTGEKIPAIGIGTWKLRTANADVVPAIKEGFGLGMKFVDTAEMYGTEDMVGEAVHGEKGIFIATKVSPDHFHYKDVKNACGRSLKELGVKRIDLYQLHWPNSRIPIAETMKAMEELVEEGKIRHIGISNFSVEEMEDAMAALKTHEIVSNQLEYSLLVRDIEDEVLGYCRKNKMTVIAYSPLARGLLFEPRNNGLLQVLLEIGKKRRKSAAQVALAWVISKADVVTIPKAANVEHMRENAGASEIKLTAAEIDRINGFLGDLSERPVTERLNKFTKYTASFWSPVMRFREKVRRKRR